MFKRTSPCLFYNVTTTAKFFFLFFYLFSLFIAKFFTYFFRTEDDECDDEMLCEDEDEIEERPKLEEEKEEGHEQEYRQYSHVGEDHLVADIVNDGDSLVFVPKGLHHDNEHHNHSLLHSNSYENLLQDPVEEFYDDACCFENSPSSSEFDHDYSNDDIGLQVDYEEIKEEYTSRFKSNPDDQTSKLREEDDSNNKNNDDNHHVGEPIYEDLSQKSSSFFELKAYGSEPKVNATESNYHDHYLAGEKDDEKKIVVKEDSNFTRDEKFLIFAPPKSEAKKLIGLELENKVIFEDTNTVGSCSKSSSEWNNSIRKSGTDDPFSSSSRRSCPKWESYAVYQKYDEEMTFLDRITAQKLHETESLKSFQVEPRSISQRIAHKLANKKKQRSNDIYKNNPYNELEVAYVAQICLTWEALNWNYVAFQRKLVSKTELLDHGCPAHIAQQFQQFQVLLQRYIENEPYERGKRPEIYSRMRSAAPKLLQVPEYHDYEGEERELIGGRIASALFLQILEDSIQTFMNFLKADTETHCQVISALFKVRPRGSIDPSVLSEFKKCNKKKKSKLIDLQRTRICLRKRKLTREEQMEILMSLIDLKVVSRVLRLAEITQEQLHWCEEKMRKVRILEGKLHRDSSPVFFPTL